MLRYVISSFCSRGFPITLAGLKNIVRYTGKIVIKGFVISECHCRKHFSSSYRIRPASDAHGEGVLIKESHGEAPPRGSNPKPLIHLSYPFHIPKTKLEPPLYLKNKPKE